MQVLIFGAGEKFSNFIKNNPISKKIDIVGLVDNDHLKWGEKLEEYIVESPEVIRTRTWDWIMIATNAFEEIKEQLIAEYFVEKGEIVKSDEFIIPALVNLGSVKLDCDYEKGFNLKDSISEKVITSNEMEQYFFQDQHRSITKWWHYFEIYHTFFQKYRGTDVRILEVGVYKGGSMHMWRDYFGTEATIVGVDIDSNCKAYEENNIHICIGSQDDGEFMMEVSRKYGPFDIVLDDGSHMMEHQKSTFATMFPLVKEGGIYLCEDLHTSYWDTYGGDLHGDYTFIEYSKNFIDCLHKQHMNEAHQMLLPVYADDIKACHYYDSIIVVEKKHRGLSMLIEMPLRQ